MIYLDDILIIFKILFKIVCVQYNAHFISKLDKYNLPQTLVIGNIFKKKYLYF